MGKASSTKKVARAARTGGRQTTQKRNLGFPLLLGGVVVLGLALVVVAVSNNRSLAANTAKPRAQGQGNPSDHWHDAFGLDICGQMQPPFNDLAGDELGIHTHGDGVIHIHPFGLKSSGGRAVLGKFFDDVGLKVLSSGIKTPDGKLYKPGETTCNGAPAKVTVAYWSDAAKATGTKPDKVYTSNFGSLKLDKNGAAFTVAFLPAGVQPRAPDSAPDLVQLGAADSGQTAPTAGSAGTGSAGAGGSSTAGTTGIDPSSSGGTATAGTTGIDPSTTGGTATGTATTGTATTGTATTGTATTGTATTGTATTGAPTP